MSVDTCPVCEGKGHVPGGFYAGTQHGGAVTCRSCGGRGTVTVEEAAAVGERNPRDLTYDGPDQ